MLTRYDDLRSEIEDIRRESGLDDAEQELAILKSQIDNLVIENALEYENDNLRIVRVQGFRRKWNVDKLEAIIPRPLFRKVIKIEVDGQKVDELVRAGKLADDQIAPAFEETPNKAYAKWTTKSDKKDGSAEAASLAEKLK